MIAAVAAAVLLSVAAAFTRGRLSLVMLAAGLFSALAALAFGINADWLAALERSVDTWSDRHRTDRRGELASGVWTFIGNPLHVLTAALVCGTLLSLRARSWVPGALVSGAVGVGVAAVETLKATIPPHTFPSGHVTGTATLLGMIAVCLAAGDSPLAKVAVGLLVAESVVLVAALAVYTGAHTLADVTGGMLLSGGILALGAAILNAATPRRRGRTGPRARTPAPSAAGIRTPARAAAGARSGGASPGRRPATEPDAITQPIPRR